MYMWKRTLRTMSSERFLCLREGQEIAAVDMHYLEGGAAAGTVILLEDAGLTETEVPSLLHSLDDDMLPGVDLDTGNLTFTVVSGRVLGNFEGAHDDKPA
ncbi:MAG: hypothetical protein WC718_08860 [Phycisphaerales bacterium]|jgi:hypothetical protein